MASLGLEKISRDAADAFFTQLPRDEFAQEEADLLELLQKIASLLEVWLPSGVSLQNWVQKRVPQEFAKDVNASRMAYLCTSGTNKNEVLQSKLSPRPVAAPWHVAHVAAPVGNVAEVENFLDSLPEQLLPWETLLLETIQLSIPQPKWMKNRGTPVSEAAWMRLADFEKTPYIKRIIQECMPDNASLKEWIERRVSDSFEVGLDRDHNYAMIRMRSIFNSEERENAVADFLESMPEGRFTPEEEDLRRAVLNFLEEWQRSHPLSPVRTDVLGQCRAVSQAKSYALPTRLTLKMWCEQRLFDDVEFMKIDGGTGNQKGAVVVVGLRGQLDPRAVQNPPLPEISHAARRKRLREERGGDLIFDEEDL